MNQIEVKQSQRKLNSNNTTIHSQSLKYMTNKNTQTSVKIKEN